MRSRGYPWNAIVAEGLGTFLFFTVGIGAGSVCVVGVGRGGFTTTGGFCGSLGCAGSVWVVGAGCCGPGRCGPGADCT